MYSPLAPTLHCSFSLLQVRMGFGSKAEALKSSYAAKIGARNEERKALEERTQGE